LLAKQLNFVLQTVDGMGKRSWFFKKRRAERNPDHSVETLEKRRLMSVINSPLPMPYLPVKDNNFYVPPVALGSNNNVTARIIVKPRGFTGSIYSIDGAPYDETGMIDLNINGTPYVVDQLSGIQIGNPYNAILLTFTGNVNSFEVIGGNGDPTVGIDICIVAEGRHNTLFGGLGDVGDDYWFVWRASEANGGVGDNYIDAYGGLDSIYGGGALNNLRSEIGQNLLSADASIVQPSTGPSTLEGTGGNDTLYGGQDDPNFMMAHGSNNTFYSGYPSVTGGTGATGDTIYGGGSNNTLYTYNYAWPFPIGGTVVGGIQNYYSGVIVYDPWNPADWPTDTLTTG
jgi:hypothetical protein